MGIGVWIFIALYFVTNIFPETPINPIRHTNSFATFATMDFKSVEISYSIIFK